MSQSTKRDLPKYKKTILYRYSSSVAYIFDFTSGNSCGFIQSNCGWNSICIAQLWHYDEPWIRTDTRSTKVSLGSFGIDLLHLNRRSWFLLFTSVKFRTWKLTQTATYNTSNLITACYTVKRFTNIYISSITNGRHQ